MKRQRFITPITRLYDITNLVSRWSDMEKIWHGDLCHRTCSAERFDSKYTSVSSSAIKQGCPSSPSLTVNLVIAFSFLDATPQSHIKALRAMRHGLPGWAIDCGNQKGHKWRQPTFVSALPV